MPGYEADDVIGTLATRAAAAGMQAVIVSGDKDFYQLIGPGVCAAQPGAGRSRRRGRGVGDESNASERLGVPPEQVIDYLAMVGDSSDNIPGVKGIGEKGAQKLLAEYGGLDDDPRRRREVEQKRRARGVAGQCRQRAAVQASW